jgi:ankyrin repeat protein
MLSVLRGNQKIFDILVDKADKNKVNESLKRTALHYAAEANRSSMIEKLLTEENKNMMDKYGIIIQY